MYSKMLRQFSKGSLISISSESSKILYKLIWFNLCRQYLLFHALNVSLCYQFMPNNKPFHALDSLFNVLSRLHGRKDKNTFC